MQRTIRLGGANLTAVITSVGAVTGHGLGTAKLFAALLRGRSAIAQVTRFPVEGLCSSLAAEAPPDAELDRVLDAFGGERRADRATRLLLAASVEALGGRALQPSPRRGVIVGTTKGAFELLGAPASSDDLLGVPARALARATRALGPTFGVSAACASGAVAIGDAVALIEADVCDEVVVGGTEALHAFVYRGFHALRALSARPALPFDAARNGLSLGEGAGVLVLESAGHARAAGRRPMAVVEGFGSSTDAHDQVAPEPGGRGLLAAIRQALARAGITAEDICSYHAHGTGTVQNDRMEAGVVAALFSGRALTLSAIKGSVGHTLGAAGALDAIACVLMLEAAVIPPVTNLTTLDPRAPVPAVIGQPRPLGGDRILAGSAGFGGINAALVLRGGGRW